MVDDFVIGLFFMLNMLLSLLVANKTSGLPLMIAFGHLAMKHFFFYLGEDWGGIQIILLLVFFTIIIMTVGYSLKVINQKNKSLS